MPRLPSHHREWGGRSRGAWRRTGMTEGFPTPSGARLAGHHSHCERDDIALFFPDSQWVSVFDGALNRSGHRGHRQIRGFDPGPVGVPSTRSRLHLGAVAARPSHHPLPTRRPTHCDPRDLRCHRDLDGLANAASLFGIWGSPAPGLPRGSSAASPDAPEPGELHGWHHRGRIQTTRWRSGAPPPRNACSTTWS